MSNVQEVLVTVGSIYLALSASVVVWWVIEIYRSVVARQTVMLLREAWITDSPEELAASTGREAFGLLLNDLDNLIRNRSDIQEHDIERYIIALSMAHLLRIDADRRINIEVLAPNVRINVASRARLQRKFNISPAVLGIYLEKYHLSRFKIKCLAKRLTQNWEEFRQTLMQWESASHA